MFQIWQCPIVSCKFACQLPHNFTTSKPLATQNDTSIPTYPMTSRGQDQQHPPLATSAHASTMDRCLQTGSHLMVVSPLPSLGIMPSCAAAAEYRAVSKAPLSILFWSDSRFKLRSDMSSIYWQTDKTLPRRADNFGSQNAVPDFDERLIDFIK